ncbi:MAG: hypothetical protein M1833_004602 [Piccolia ochrophora]|nr:MAG: hypothetical protein M1833_004602 [Piccolia ochrophora]
MTAPLKVTSLTTTTGSAPERRSLELFKDKALRGLWGQHEPADWMRLILQGSESEPAIRHAVVAVSALYEKDCRVGSSEPADDMKAKHGFALQQYSKAIGALNHSISARGASSAEVALMACVMLLNFEVFQGNDFAALAHLTSGLNILCGTDNKECLASSFSDGSVAQIFARFDTMVASYVGFHCPRVQLLQQIFPSSSPDPFAFPDVDQAGDMLCAEMGRMYIFLRTSAEPCKYLLPNQVPMSAISERNSHQEWLHRWSTTLDSLLRTKSNKMSTEELRDVLTFRMHSKTMYITLAVCLEGNEVAYDQFESLFADIVTLTTSIRLATPSIKGSLSLSSQLGVVSPLYATATKCRHPSIRREAVALLLASSYREGIWDGVALGRVAQCVMTWEEDGLVNVAKPQDVPEYKRIHGAAIQGLDRHHRRAVVEGSQRHGDSLEQWRFVTEEVHW